MFRGLTYKSKNVLGNPKGKTNSGIYEINCNHCNEEFDGQSRRGV